MTIAQSTSSRPTVAMRLAGGAGSCSRSVLDMTTACSPVPCRCPTIAIHRSRWPGAQANVAMTAPIDASHSAQSDQNVSASWRPEMSGVRS